MNNDVALSLESEFDIIAFSHTVDSMNEAERVWMLKDLYKFMIMKEVMMSQLFRQSVGFTG